MTFHFRPMRWRDIALVARWRYPGEYAYYNMGYLELVTVMLGQTILGPANDPAYHTALDDAAVIVGVFSYLWRSERVLEVGLALRPDLTGQSRGVGLAFVEAGLEYARREFHPTRFYLTVADFNPRARTVYERAGFRQTSSQRRRRNGRPFEMIEMMPDA